MANSAWHQSLDMCALTNGTLLVQVWTQFYCGLSQMVSSNSHVVEVCCSAVIGSGYK